MALAVLDVVSSANLVGTDKGFRVAQVTFDNSYPTGGEAITPAELQLSSVDFVVPTTDSALADKLVYWNPSTAKLLVQVISTAAEAANASDQSALVVRVFVFGTVEA